MEQLKDLQLRRTVAKSLIAQLEKITDDDRAPDALNHYRAQLLEIEARITELESKPTPVVIGLKSADLSAKLK